MPIRSFFFEGGEGGGPARLQLVIEADEERSSLVERQFMRLEDVTEVVRTTGTPAFAQTEFTLEERTA
jgi:acetolactate synthase small subunit